MISISLPDIFSLPVVARDHTAAMGRTTMTTIIQHPIGLRCKQCIVHGDFFSSLDISAGRQRHFILHPGI